MRLANKVAMITGAGSGMGEATALLFAREGAKVAVLDIDEVNGKRVADQINAEGGKAIHIGGDISNAETVQHMVARTVEELGPPNILHNNAGLSMGKLTIVNMDEATFDRCIDVNLKAPWLMMKYVVPHMIKTGGGSIINTSSIAAYLAVGSVAYCSSKAGLLAATRVAAVELGRYNIRVNAICPGNHDTPMAASTRAEMAARGIVSKLKVTVFPENRRGHPEEIANLALFLGSDESTYITGASINHDGGWTSMGGLDLNPDPAQAS